MLTHRNILENIASVNDAFALTSTRDVMVGVLPFFHSFGFTGTLWFPMITGFGVAYHPNPTDAKTIGELAEKLHGHADYQHTDVLRRAYPQDPPGAVLRTCATRSSAPRSCAEPMAIGVQREIRAALFSKATGARRWRRSFR